MVPENGDVLPKHVGEFVFMDNRILHNLYAYNIGRYKWLQAKSAGWIILNSRIFWEKEETTPPQQELQKPCRPGRPAD